jgi:mannose-6-phosphate isomerase-like protein (cupin superfamily)
MTTQRPSLVGSYELLQDFDAVPASVRVFRLASGAEAVQRHLHHHSSQIYVALEGRVAIDRDGAETELVPYEAAVVTPGTLHAARPIDGPAVVMNISVPPLAADDQFAVSSDEPHPDLQLPGRDSALED